MFTYISKQGTKTCRHIQLSGRVDFLCSVQDFAIDTQVKFVE